MHYWNFNSNASESDLLGVSYTEVGGATISQIVGGISEIVPQGGTGQDFDAENINARFGDEAGSHLRFNDPIGGGILWSIPTSGHEGIVVNYATRRSGSGAGNQLIAYTTDGVSFTEFTTLAITTTPTLATLDFSAIEGANDNPNFAIRILFELGDGGDGGNNRFDNFSVEGFAIGGMDTAAPVATLSPSANSINQPTDVLMTIAFNEPVTLNGGVLLAPENIASAVALRLDDENGADVPFSATYAENTITVTPNAALDNNQVYYLVLSGNSVEDLSGNVLTEDRFTSFSTIAVQSELNAGDFAIVAYRMNTSDIDDEFAFITFVDILPGTLVNIADNKYTTNAQAQCAGGLTWTAPVEGVLAGTVVLIGNDGGTASVGTVTGSTFGLSSNGDQIMMYTGNAASANHVTALSSNGWVLENTSCSGSLSLIPATLEDGVSALNTSTAPDATEGNLVNGYYNGPQDLAFPALKSAILDPANWVGTGNGTPGQIWPNWAFGDVPAVVSVSVLDQTNIEITFNRNISESTANDAGNYTGIEGLVSAQLIIEGDDAKKVLLTYGAPFPAATPLSLTIFNIESEEGTAMAAPYVFEFEYNTELAFDEDFLTVNEGDGEVTITLTLSNPSVSSVTLVRKDAPWSSAGTEDYVFENTDLTFDGASPAEVSITIPIADDAVEEQDEYFTLYLENSEGLAITGNPFITVYITDNDRMAPVANLEIELSYITSYNPAGEGESSTVEVISYDPATQRLFATSAIENRFDIIDFSNPASPSTITSVDMAPYGGITSVAVKNGVLAVASPNADEQMDGSVVFFDTDGNFIVQIAAGALPDMVTFTPDGSKVLTANEGQPNNAYTIDPEGSVTVIDISGGVESVTQANATTLDFTAFNAMEEALRAAGVRKTFEASTLSQDLEPEYITVRADGDIAWVTLQENNAIAEIDLTTLTITAVKPLGTKDYNLFGNGMDASDQTGEVLRANWPVKGFLIPDAMGNYMVDGITYIVTANEGDEKEYGPLEERAAVSSLTLDPTAFPHAEVLQQSHNLGRFRATNLQGDTDGDGDFDEIYAVGARSFSIINTATMEIVYDSGDDFEFITQMDPVAGPLFNASNDNNNFKNRSRAKGPEPEGIAVEQINGETYAFVTLERTGGLMVYNISDPNNPSFVDYKNTRSLEELGGDLGPEVVIYINPSNSPDGKAYALISNEVSGTITVFEVLGVEDEVIEPGDCAEFRYFLADAPVGATSSDIYGVEIAGENAELTYLTTVDYQAHLGFDEASKQLYVVNRNNGAFEVLDINTSTLTGPVALSSNLPNVAAAVVNAEGDLLVGDETSDNVFVVDVLTGNAAQLSGESLTGIFGGDLVYAADGTLYYASRLNGGELRDVLTNEVVGNMPANVTGAALMPSGNLITSSRSWDNLRVFGPTGSDAPIAMYNTFLDGEAIVVKTTDLAGGCTDNDVTVDGCEGFEVLAFEQGLKTNGQPVAADRSNEDAAIGMPDASNAPGGFVSLGVGGSITIGFSGAVIDGPGNDIMVYETSFSGDVCGFGDDETADIAVSQNGVLFVPVGSICRDGGVDIAGAGLDYVTSVRITNSNATGTLDGYDVDGVVAIYGCEPITEIETGECAATEVVEYIEGTKSNGNALPLARTDSDQALGQPEGTDAMVFVTLGYDGSITLAFDGSVPNEAGADIEVVETSFNNAGCAAYPEYADILVSQDGEEFIFVKTVCKSDNLVDIDDAGQGWDYVNFVKVVNNNLLTTSPDGYDLDGVRAIYNCVEDDNDDENGPSVAILAEVVSLLSSQPNPTTGQSTVFFKTVTTSYATLEVFDMSGRSIATLYNQVANEGQEYRFDFDGAYLSNGVYIYRLTTENDVVIEKFMIAR
jgi:hypothetical protein